MDELVERWLSENFQNKDTKIVYRSALNLYKQKILRGLSYRESLRRYKANKKRFFDNEGMCDIKRFMVSLQKRPSATKNVYVNVVKIFFAEHGLPIPDALWKRTKKRLMKGGSRTKDKAPNHKELKTITSHMDLKGRALTLFLASSGCRIGETLQLTVNDLDLEADPPRAHLRKEYTKYGEEGRLVFMNYEARDLIKDWLKIKHTVLKRDGRGDYGGKRVWNMSTHNARVIWNRAVEKARLQTRDVETGRRTLHLHSLRKFFRSYIKLPWDIVQGLMGHHAYLDKAYERIRESELAEMYREAIPSVSIYSAKPSRKEEIKRFVAMSGTNIATKRLISSFLLGFAE